MSVHRMGAARIAAAAGLTLIVGAVSASTARAQQAPAPTAAAYTLSTVAGPTEAAVAAISGPIRPADVVRVVVADGDDFSGEFRVDAAGNVALPRVGPVHLGGQTPDAAGWTIGDRLVAGKFLRRASVTVYVIARRTPEVMVNGSVATQGRQAIQDGALLSEVIETAGLQPGADLSRVVIDRGGHMMSVNYRRFRDGLDNSAAANPTLGDGDRIYVYASDPTDGTIHIVGEVKDSTKTTLPLTAGETVGQALQEAGGVTDLADRDHIAIVRGGDRVPVAYADLLGNVPGKDIVLQDRDEISVPRLDRPRQFTVAGAVRSPNTYPLNGNITLLSAVGAAGGPQDGAKETAIVLRRRAADGTIATRTCDLTHDQEAAMLVQDGDYIEVPYPRHRSDAASSANGIIGLLGGLAVIFGHL